MWLRSNTVSSLHIVYELYGYTKEDPTNNLSTTVGIDSSHQLVTYVSINEIPSTPYHLGVFIYPKPSKVSHIYEIYLDK